MKFNWTTAYHGVSHVSNAEENGVRPFASIIDYGREFVDVNFHDRSMNNIPPLTIYSKSNKTALNKAKKKAESWIKEQY